MPAAVDAVPAAVDAVPAAVDAVPAAVDAVPAALDAVPAKLSAVPAELSAVPATFDADGGDSDVARRPVPPLIREDSGGGADLVGPACTGAAAHRDRGGA